MVRPSSHSSRGPGSPWAGACILARALAGCGYSAQDVPTGWDLVLATCFLVVVGPIYLYLRELIRNLLPEITFRQFLIASGVLFVVLLVWLRVLALRAQP